MEEFACGEREENVTQSEQDVHMLQREKQCDNSLELNVPEK